jgi:soluble lytic murein transglycosylase-like protein
VALVAGLTALWATSHERSVAAEQAAVTKEDARERKIVAWIVDRNPRATIKDFAGFPKILIEESERAGLDYRLVMAVIDKESGFKPDAVGASGEIGLMQIMPLTAEDVVREVKGKFKYVPPTPGKNGSRYNSLGSLADPATNVRIGIAHLKWQLDKYADPVTALRSYNRGDAAAKQNRPRDQYAEDVAKAYLKIVRSMPL